jgi:CDP-diacylglycerol--glycerol-3-phosphate 3-phosphatidyltransferase
MVIAASNLGKYKTVFEATSITFLIVHGTYVGIDFHAIGMFFLWLAMILAVLSGVDYFRKFLKTVIV